MTSDGSSRAVARQSPSRGRPRNEESDIRILDAAREILAERGVDAMSFEAIAQRAGATRPSIYRRWPTKAHLLNEIANGPGGYDTISQPDTSVEQAVRNLATRVLQHYGKPEVRAANVGLIAAYQHSPDLRALLQSPIEARARQDLAASFAIAMEAGHLAPSARSDAVFDMVVGAIVFRTIFSAAPLDEDVVDWICDLILAGLDRPRL